MLPGLVSAEWLAAHLRDPSLRLLDVTTYMTPQPVGPSRITSGRGDWARAHLPGAGHVDMVEDLSDPGGRHPYTLPPASQIESLLSRLGIGNEHHLILYGARHPMVVTRAWWVLTTLGHPRVSILDGGLEGWRAAGLPLTDAVTTPPPARFSARLRSERLADADRVAESLEHLDAARINALSPEQFRGQGGAHYGRPGRIPRSVSVPARDLVDMESGRWHSATEIAQRLADAGLTDRRQPIITYCGGGIAATVPFFALEALGFENVALYDNSLLEWSADPARPMERD